MAFLWRSTYFSLPFLTLKCSAYAIMRNKMKGLHLLAHERNSSSDMQTCGWGESDQQIFTSVSPKRHYFWLLKSHKLCKAFSPQLREKMSVSFASKGLHGGNMAFIISWHLSQHSQSTGSWTFTGHSLRARHQAKHLHSLWFARWVFEVVAFHVFRLQTGRNETKGSGKGHIEY